MYSLTDQSLRASREVCAHIAEAWGRRLYRADLINPYGWEDEPHTKLNMGESEARETQSWLGSRARRRVAVECEYITKEVGGELFQLYNNVIGKLVTIENNPDQWLLKPKR